MCHSLVRPLEKTRPVLDGQDHVAGVHQRRTLQGTKIGRLIRRVNLVEILVLHVFYEPHGVWRDPVVLDRCTVKSDNGRFVECVGN